MWSAIFQAIAAVPQIAALIERLVSWIVVELASAKEKKKLEDLDKGIALAKEKKDTRGIEEFFNPGKKGKKK